MKIKRIIALFITICLLSSIFCITPVFADTIYLDQEGYVYGETDMHYFTPEESGFYRLKMWTDPYAEASDSGYVNVYYDDYYNGYYYINPLFNIMHNNEMTMYGACPQSYYYYLEEGIEYTFEMRAGNGVYSSYVTTNYLLTTATISDLGEYTIGTDVNVEIYPFEPAVFNYIATESRQVLFSTDMGAINVYDIEEMTTSGGGWSSQLITDVIEGHEYFIILGCIDSEFQGTVTLSSTYVEQVDNSPVDTNNVDEMHSSHPYQNELDKSWTYNAPDETIYNEITFDSSSRLAYGDVLYVYDADGNEVKYYNYWSSSFANQTLTIPGNKFTIRLDTDYSDVSYGFGLSSVNSYSTVPSPSASLESGTIRPSKVTITGSSLATFYYKLSTEDDEGEFAKYSAAIEINEDCTLSVYAKIGDKVSETVTYNYTIDNTPIPAPQFTVKSSSASSITLAITATEGDVYYKRMSDGYSYSKLSTNGAITVYQSDVIAAYAMNGTLKSEVVYYSCNLTDNTIYELIAPIITETPIMGGKSVTISIPQGFEYRNIEEKTNYGQSHHYTECGQNEYVTHDMGPWSRKYESTYTYVSVGDADKKIESDYYYKATDFPKTYDVYQNTAFSAKNNYYHESESGVWCSYDMSYGYGDYYHDLSNTMDGYDPNYVYDYYSQESPRSYKYIEVPKANKPEFTISDGKLQISANDGEIIHYTFNNGTEKEYTEPFDVKNGDIIHAYAIGMGIAKSDIAQYKVMLEGVNIKETAVLGGYEIEVISADSSAEVYYSIDGESYNPYSEKLFVTEDTTLYAYSVLNGKQSDTKSVSVNVPKATAPTPSHESGTYGVGTSISFTNKNASEQIYYVREENTIKYTNAITLNNDMDISVYAIGIGIAKSEVKDYSYKILKTAAPTITETDILGGKLITISTTTEGASIQYKINDGEYTLYSEPFEVYDLAKICAYTSLEGAADSAVTEHNVVMVQTADPVPNYASGEVFSGTNIELTSHNDGAQTVIYYTLDGTKPTEESTVYTDGIKITGPTTIKAIAYAKGRAASEIVTLNYILRQTKTPSVTEQNVKGGKKLYIQSKTENSTVYYTLDGTDPKTSDTVILYEAPFIVGESGTKVRAYAKANGYMDSDILEHTVEIGQLPAPVLSITDENVYLNASLTITADPIADVYYTLDGSKPTKESTLYTSPITITDDVTIKAIAISEGWQDSDVIKKSYKIYTTEKPYITKIKNGDRMKVELKSETPNSTIYYTLDGTEPTKSSSIYKDAIMLSADTTIKAFAVSENRKSSDIYTETVLVRHTADPVVNLPSGEITRTDKITITANKDAKIYYTIDGSTPTEESILYSGPFSITSNTTLKVFAVEEGFLDSNTLTYEYTIKRAKNPEILLNEDILGGKSIKIESADDNATIYYTTDGTEPTTNSLTYKNPINIYNTTVIRALAVVEGCDNSEIAYREMAVPVADIIQSNSTKKLLKDDFINTNFSTQTVYYTLDGTTPDLSSKIYEPGTIKLDKDVLTIKAFAIGYGYAQSEVITTYYIVKPTDTYISVKYGENDAEITLTSNPQDATMYYTLDGSDPSLSTNVNRILYTDTFKITQNVKLTVYTTADRYDSSVTTQNVYVNMAKQPELGVTQPSYSIYGTTYLKSGSYVTLRSPNGVKIRYTLDGTEPTAENGIEYTSPICINTDTTIKAYCYGDEYENSLVKTFYIDIFNVMGKVMTENVPGGKNITILPIAGANTTYYTHMGTYFKDFTVYYTTDGTDPNKETSKIYMQVDANGEYVVEPKDEWFTDKDITVKVLVVANNCNTGDIVSEDITVKKLNKPSHLPAETTIYKNSYISLETAEPGAKVYYTTDGTEPTIESPIYDTPFTIADDTTIKMIAVKPGMATSDMVVVNYSLKRTETPTITKDMTVSGMKITLDCETENAKIYYTTNGDTPTEKSTLYTGPFKLKKNTMFNCIAISDNMKESYTVSELIDVPTAKMQIVGISDVSATAGGYAEATLYFQNNPGIAAYAISVEYDNSVLTPVSAQNLLGGIFTTNIDKGAQSGIEDAISMLWINNTSFYDDSNVVKLTFKVKDGAEEGITPLYIKENGVINHLFEMVDVAYMDGSVKINKSVSKSLASASVNKQNAKQTQYTDTKLSMTTNIKDNKLTVNVIVDENSGIGAYNISMLYDNQALTPVSVKNGNLFTSDLMSNVTQPGSNLSEMSEITVLSCNDNDTTENGILYTVTFDINTSDAEGQMIGFSDVMLLDVNGNKIVGIYEDATIKNETKTVTTVQSGKVTVTPYNVPLNNSIIVALYKNKCLTFCKEFINDNNEISFNMPDVEVDTIRVFVWENMNNMRAISTITDEVSVK